MTVKLKVLHGKLKGKDGSATLDVEIKKRSFVIGAAEDCQMRCPSGSISPHHCEIVVAESEVRLRDLGSDSGTFLNEQRVEVERLLQSGDRLRIGRLEFELVIEASAAAHVSKGNAVDEFVSELLVEADEEERATRIADPRLREFHLEEVAKQEHTEEPAEESAEEDRESALRKKLPRKGKPGKLPKPPSFTAEDTVSAAEQTLKKIFEQPKTKRRDS